MSQFGNSRLHVVLCITMTTLCRKRRKKGRSCQCKSCRECMHCRPEYPNMNHDVEGSPLQQIYISVSRMRTPRLRTNPYEVTSPPLKRLASDRHMYKKLVLTPTGHPQQPTQHHNTTSSTHEHHGPITVTITLHHSHKELYSLKICIPASPSTTLRWQPAQPEPPPTCPSLTLPARKPRAQEPGEGAARRNQVAVEPLE